MRNQFITISSLLFFSLLLAGCATTKSANALLAEVWNNDQQPRHQMVELTKAVTVEGRTDLIDSLILVNDIVERNDAKNIKDWEL